MVMKYKAVFLTSIFLVALVPAVVGAQAFPLGAGFASLGAAEAFGTGYFGTLGVRKYINSFTSYQFPHPVTTQLDPLSRLEWPWEQWCGVVKVGYISPAWNIALTYSSTALLFSGLQAQDSDWTNPAAPGQKTVFSEGKAKPRVWTFDTSIAGFPVAASLIQGIIGFRAQQFNFTYTDATQYEIGAAPIYLPGAGIEFSEHYYHWYGGGIIRWATDLGDLYGPLRTAQLGIRLQGDYGYVKGSGVDFHILRAPGPRITFEQTTGHSWHVNATVDFRVTSAVALGVEGDYIGIWTVGTHQWTEPGTNWTWDGSKVWSEQKYVAVTGSVNF